MTFVLLVFYAWPYQVATETLRDGNQLDWLAGESILARVRGRSRTAFLLCCEPES